MSLAVIQMATGAEVAHNLAQARQLLEQAAEAGARYLALLDANRAIVAHEVTINLLDRHIRRIFPAC